MNDKQLSKIIVERMRKKVGAASQQELAKILGIKPPSISGAIQKGKIPDRWFDVIEEKYGVSKEELLRHACPGTPASDICETAPGITGVMQSGEPTSKHVRNYREIAELDDDILKEIQTWLNDMEVYRPGFTAWFRLEFQNRFPEFDEWKMKQFKKAE